jgi:hypothetical protein
MQKHRPDLGSAYDRPPASTESTETSLSPRRYQRLLRNVVLSTASVAVIPLLIMTGLNLSQSRQAIQREARHPISRLTSAGKLFIELFLQERATALRMIVNSGLVTKDCSNEQLAMVLKSLRTDIPHPFDR